MPAFKLSHLGLQDRNGCHLEVYPRSNGEVYICGIGGSQHKTAANLREGGDCEHQVRGAGIARIQKLKQNMDQSAPGARHVQSLD